MSIQSTSSADGKTLTIAVKGRFDFSSLQIFRNAYEKVEIKPEHYLVDLKESEYYFENEEAIKDPSCGELPISFEKIEKFVKL